jgi:hypothetical protein
VATHRGSAAATAWVAAAALLLAGCGATTAPSPPGPTTSAPEPSLTLPPGGVTPPPSEPAASPGVVAPAVAGDVRCASLDIMIPAAVFQASATAELAPDDAANALRQYVHSPTAVEAGWPAAGWRLVSHTSDAATFLARGPTTWWIATFAPAGGGWEFNEGGACDLGVALPEGVGFASWRVDPATPPAPGDTALHLLGTELACANGKPPQAARILDPIVLPGDQAITIALLVRQVPGGADCPGNPEFPITIDLAEPLGSRALFDGSTVPPTARS